MSDMESNREVEKVLIVDDEQNMRRTLNDILEDEGYDVATAATGEEAIELCSENDYEIILMDVRMPGMEQERRQQGPPAQPQPPQPTPNSEPTYTVLE